MAKDSDSSLEQVGLLCLAIVTQMYLNVDSMPKASVLRKIRKALERAGVELPPALQPDTDNIDPNQLERCVKQILQKLP